VHNKTQLLYSPSLHVQYMMNVNKLLIHNNSVQYLMLIASFL